MLVNGTILRNHYQIVQQLGSGGFADTYLAKDMDLPTYAQCVVKIRSTIVIGTAGYMPSEQANRDPKFTYIFNF
ncbi:MAG: hypothetical protein NHB32_29335 [Fischerella sp. CENA71]|nr:hypothetical protein [Fischerella sp. CENA71]